MDESNVIASEPTRVSVSPAEQRLDFLWLELTSRCNLRCIHCYAESSPSPEQTDVLSAEDYFGLINAAASCGCRKIQFIGGEPTVVKELPEFIVHARNNGFEFIEVFTNATRISDQLLSCFADNGVAIATSFYSDRSEVHDAITKKAGSHHRTMEAIKKLLEAGLSVRAGIIVMKENNDRVNETLDYLYSIGVKYVGTDRIRAIGRGVSLPTLTAHDTAEPTITELCGSCWQGSLCIFPDGKAAPCIMARNWPIGSVLDTTLAELVQSQVLQDIRSRIYQEVWLPSVQQGGTYGSLHKGEALDSQCGPPCGPVCIPGANPPPTCQPTHGGPCTPQCWPGGVPPGPCYPDRGGPCSPRCIPGGRP
jgi:organic radical activating enzyme